jgi:hypothetical protein
LREPVAAEVARAQEVEQQRGRRDLVAERQARRQPHAHEPVDGEPHRRDDVGQRGREQQEGLAQPQLRIVVVIEGGEPEAFEERHARDGRRAAIGLVVVGLVHPESPGHPAAFVRRKCAGHGDRPSVLHGPTDRQAASAKDRGP